MQRVKTLFKKLLFYNYIWNGNNSEEVFCDVLDNGLRLKFFIRIREGPRKMLSKFLNPDPLN